MKDFSDKVSYLQGLSEGLIIREGSPQGKIISGILNVLNEMAEEISFVEQEVEEIKEYMESIDDDLLDLEETVFEEEFLQINCSKCGESLYIEHELMNDEDVIEVICPNCNEVVYVNDGSFDYEYSPPDAGIGEEKRMS
ncbi:MAG: AraC family transcriptional regulator [Bacillota bacterium]|nr:AraC family transcriptional regulator [Bacillota bacterium]